MPMPREFDWMDSKYGDDLRPWQIAFEFDNNYHDPQKLGQFAGGDEQWTYSFTIRNTKTGQMTPEREPIREINILDPNQYRGELAK